VTDDVSDCAWYGEVEEMEEDGPVKSGCCYATSVQSLAFSADLCQQYWTDESCAVSYDAHGANNCRWRPTDDDVDCDGLMTFVAAVSSSSRQNQKTLVIGSDSLMMDQTTKALNGEVSLMTVLMMFAAMFAVYRLYCCYKSARTNDGYEKLGDGNYGATYGRTGYQSMA